MADGESTPVPRINIEKGATPEQRAALEDFESLAGIFSDTELRSVIALVDRYPAALNDVLPLTKDPEATDKLFKSWGAIIQTQAYLVSDFDEQTEQAILNDPEFIALKANRDRAASGTEAESYRDAIIRFRFVAFGGRLATSQVVNNDESYRRPA